MPSGNSESTNEVPEGRSVSGNDVGACGEGRDVACLRPIDVSLKNTIREDGTVSLGIEQSQGKGARFRGTYWPASILHQEEATKLRHAMAKVGRMQLIFHDHLELRTLIRTALRLENRESALPSVRKGLFAI
eukprot:gene7175-biopygen4658